jgi:hypothetical protein
MNFVGFQGHGYLNQSYLNKSSSQGKAAENLGPLVDYASIHLMRVYNI